MVSNTATTGLPNRYRGMAGLLVPAVATPMELVGEATMRANPSDPTIGTIREVSHRISVHIGHGPIRPTPSTSNGGSSARSDSVRPQRKPSVPVSQPPNQSLKPTPLTRRGAAELGR